MAKNCLCCGRNIGLLTVRISLLENEDLVLCSECFNKMPPIINELYQKRITLSKTELIEIKAEVICNLMEADYNLDVINVVTKFFDNKIAEARDLGNSEEGKILKICPVCKKNINYSSSVCSDCGFIFDGTFTIENFEIAKIYNSRFEQYKKNPFYEYDYIVIPNKSDGSTNKEKIKEILNDHAIQGWRLITMYSNEIGKDSIVGVNATICEDILVFERCIKASGCS